MIKARGRESRLAFCHHSLQVLSDATNGRRKTQSPAGLTKELQSRGIQFIFRQAILQSRFRKTRHISHIMRKFILILALAAVCSPLLTSQAQAAQGKHHKGNKHSHHQGKHHKKP
jgi:hypothetical protein